MHSEFWEGNAPAGSDWRTTDRQAMPAGHGDRACRAREGFAARGVPATLCTAIGIAAYFVTAAAGFAMPAQRPGSVPAQVEKADANLLQLMRGSMFAQANVIFAGQTEVGAIPHDPLPAVSPNPLTSVYGGWQAVENSSLALAESAKLLIVPGRMCANGKAVPVREAAWVNYVSGMHEAALEAYKAAQTKNIDEMAEAAGKISDSCAACHNVYRSNREGLAARCTATQPAAR
jgi:hypothetical protein